MKSAIKPERIVDILPKIYRITKNTILKLKSYKIPVEEAKGSRVKNVIRNIIESFILMIYSHLEYQMMNGLLAPISAL